MTTPNPSEEPAVSVPTVSGIESVRESLTYARDTAKEELDRIEKIHQRTLNYIAIFLGAATVVFGVLGYLGFSNLKSLAVETASKTEREEVTKQVAEKLTQADINKIVRDQMQDFVNQDLRTALEKEVNQGPLHREILETAAQQSNQLISKSFSQRHLSPANAARLTTAINSRPIFQTYGITFSETNFDLEATRYLAEIQKAIAASKAMVVELAAGAPAVQVSDGVIIYYDEKDPPFPATELLQCFEAAGIPARIAGAKFDRFEIGSGQTRRAPGPVINVTVGPRPLPR